MHDDRPAEVELVDPAWQLGERDVHRPGDRVQRTLAVVADVDDAELRDLLAACSQRRGGQPGRDASGTGVGLERRLDADEVRDHAVEADAGHAQRRLVRLGPVGRNDHHVVARRDDHADVLGEATVEPDVHRAGEVPGGEVVRAADIEQDRTVDRHRHRTVEVDLGHVDRRQELVALAVRGGGVEEVVGGCRLVRGHQGDELLDVHRCQCVVLDPLPPDRRHGLGRQVLATRGPGAVGRVHQRVVGQRHELAVQRVVQGGTELVRAHARRGQQVGASDVADEERVTGEDRDGIGALTT